MVGDIFKDMCVTLDAKYDEQEKLKKQYVYVVNELNKINEEINVLEGMINLKLRR